VPRLFLLISVGSVYVRSKEAPARDILKDLVEMCRGVQHPMRGLFLRSYLLQCARDKLPDVGSEYGEEVSDSIDFLMHNFAEMNKLWVRMQHQGPVRDRERREKERLDLRILVGTNLVRLSNLEGVDAPCYKALVLPRILEQVINCKDQIAQQYLMECIIQVFPDEFHLETLSDLLEAIQQLQAGVDVKSILVALMNRLAAFAKNDPSQIPPDVDMLAVFHSHVSKLSESNLPLATFLDLQVGLLNFALGFAPGRLDFVDDLLSVCGGVLSSAETQRLEGPAEQACVSLLTSPLLATSDPLTVLDLPHYSPLIAYLPLDSRKEVAVLLTRLMRKTGALIREPGHMDATLTLIQPLVKDVVEDQGQTDDQDDEDFEAEQGAVASLVHAIRNDDPTVLFQIYFVARKHFGQGGSRRIKYTLPALVFRALQLARNLRDLEIKGEEPGVTSKKVFGFTLDTIKGLAGSEPALALRLFLQGAEAANKCEEDKIAYEFVSQAFMLYEDEISDSKVQMELVQVSCATLCNLNKLDPEDYDTLVTNTTKHAARLLKKPDQCRAVCLCSHLFWNPNVRYEDDRSFQDGKRVLDCLQRALKIADVCMQSGMNVSLFIEILNRYVYYFEAGNDKITLKYLQGLLDLVKEHLSAMEAGPDADAVRAHYNGTVAHIKRMKEEGDERFAELTI